jgi:hypothetical protein
MQLSTADFARIFGVEQSVLPKACLGLIEKADLAYEEPSPQKRDEIVLGVIKHIDSDALTQVGQQREDMWERCWAENLEKFVSSGYEAEALVPKFLNPGQPVRFNQRYVLPRGASFEVGFFQVCRAFYYEKYFKEIRSAYEFGCGTGFNLVALGMQMPKLKLHGLDWSRSACEMVNITGKKLNLDITGAQFDFFNPDRNLKLDPHSAVMTMCALEQVGPRHGPFLEFLLEKRPQICIHMEPIEELYDEGNLADYLALRYHRKRRYLSGFLPRLKDLEAEGRIKILEVRRMFFGSLYHEGYSFVVWKPV